MQKINITIITDLDDLLESVTEYADNIAQHDFGYQNHRISDFRNVYTSLIEWKVKNYRLLDALEQTMFDDLMIRIEKLRIEFM